MKLRIFTEPQQGASYEELLRVAKAAEALGFDAFFRSDHYLKMGDMSGLPGPTDAWITLAGLARDTSTIRLGTLVNSATFRLPGPLAIAVAQVDAMSGGRVELGLGAGWFEAEHAAYGIEFPSLAQRFDRFSEQVEIIHGLWNAPAEFSYQGEHYQLNNSPALPKPVQSPHLPLILGGAGKKRSATLAARFADEYNKGFASVAETGEVFDRIRVASAQTGRQLRLSAAQVACVGATEAEVAARATAIGREPVELRENGLAGSPSEVADKIGQFAEVGTDTIYLQILDLTDLDHLELLASLL
jgi:F420-dependent oxidoreductase-like protein